jgi:hypothetical protein
MVVLLSDRFMLHAPPRAGKRGSQSHFLMFFHICWLVLLAIGGGVLIRLILLVALKLERENCYNHIIVKGLVVLRRLPLQIVQRLIRVLLRITPRQRFTSSSLR